MNRRLFLAVVLAAFSILGPSVLKPTPAFASEESACGDAHKACIKNCYGNHGCIDICNIEYWDCIGTIEA